ncbi:alpha/beta hydrolase [Gordonia sp. NPDC003504]
MSDNRSEAYHPELRSVATLLPRAIVGHRSLPVVRRLSRLPGRRTPHDVDVVSVSEHVRVRVYGLPHDDTPRPVLLWIHGGGYVMGSAGQDDALCRRFARRLGLPVVSVDYRLAPEDPYPAAIDDCYAALAWVTSRSWVDSTRIAIGGASAGGGLAASLALAARDRGAITPAFQLLVYPMLDDRTGRSPHPNERRFRIWNSRSNQMGWQAYLCATDDPKAAPARVENLSGLAPAWIGGGSLDPLYEEGLAYAARLRAAGVPCTALTVPGAFHGFDAVLPRRTVSREFFNDQCAAVSNGLGL